MNATLRSLSLIPCLLAAACIGQASIASADSCSFSLAEGYSSGALSGQPGSGSIWDCTSYATSSIFNVRTNVSHPLHPEFLQLSISGQHGPSSQPVTPDYATKRMTPVSGSFYAGFSFNFNGQAQLVDQTNIALGQSADSNWATYFGLNETSTGSLAAQESSGWTEIYSFDDTSNHWYNVEIAGDTNTGLFNVTLYDEELRSDTDPAAGRLAQLYDLSFLNTPTELAYVMLTNEGSGKDTGAYHQYYDDLILLPEPATMLLLCTAGLLALRRKPRA